MSGAENGGMTFTPLTTEPISRTTGFVRLRAALRLGHAGPAAAAARAERAQRRNQARSDRAHRLAVARFGAYPAGRAATTLHHGGWGA